MPAILRLRREHPDRLPSVPMGAAHFFPEGVVHELRTLAEAEGLLGGPEDVAPRGLHSLARRRWEVGHPGPSAPAPEDVATPSAPAPAPPAQDQAPPPPVSQTRGAGPHDEDLARRLGALERDQRELIDEIADLIQRLERPSVAWSTTG